MPKPQKLILKCALSPGDIVMLTAAVRDLHRSNPGRFLTDVRTSCPELWEHNPWITPIHEFERGVRVIECKARLINQSNRAPYHFIHGFAQDLAKKLNVSIHLTAFGGDIYISAEEKSWYSQIHELAGRDLPFWIIVSGGKYDYTIKWWDSTRYQKVVDHFQGRIQFVQVGDYGHYHPPLKGVIDLRGRTDLRQLVRLVYHSQGILCPVTSLMHLAAAVPTCTEGIRQRPCVVVAGAREPMHWEAYPTHQYIHHCGALPCCSRGGCWRDRTWPLGDGSIHDKPENLCVDRVGTLPRCMEMITPEEVVRRIEVYFDGGLLKYLSPIECSAAKRAVASSQPDGLPERYSFDDVLTEHTANVASERFIETIPAYPGNFSGRGIIICGGGLQYCPGIWVCVHQLKSLGCKLPVEVWHLGASEWDPAMSALLEGLGVRCVNAEEVRRRHPARILGGWELKSYALLHSGFKEIILLDADNVPVVDPSLFFDTPEYRETGALFWPDIRECRPGKKMWRIFGVPYRKGPEFESGQIVMDKERCWRPLVLSSWYNQHSDFYYRHIMGDKETFHMAFRKLDAPWSMPARRPRRLGRCVMCQHDFQGHRAFQHRNIDKWNIWARQKRVLDFWFERECREYLEELRKVWDGRTEALNVYRKRARSPAFPVTIQAVMISCRKRERIRKRTLESLRASDWGKREIDVQLDPGSCSHPQESQLENTRRALANALEKKTDYILFLEDDLQFNLHFWHNLQTWKPLQKGVVSLAGLCAMPGVRQKAADVQAGCWVAEPQSIYGSQAFLLSRETAEYVLKNWESESGYQDIRVSRLAARLGHPILYHYPSLVQHVGFASTWGGKFRWAVDYDHEWRRED
jgi:ADP-heptose:LPS heptosyltransferase